MAKLKKSPKPQGAYPKLPAKAAAEAPQPQSYAARETVESIVIAFVLAFLIRTFEAEAFVIPTGSMAPTLMGRHKDVVCPKCGHRFRISASEEESEEPTDPRPPQLREIVAGVCPICRYTTPVRPDLPAGTSDNPNPSGIERESSYNGDRIIVNKYLYTVRDPQRWDVIVFKFPGNAQMNYIKRLVGLPGEVIRVYQGDLFVGANHGAKDAEFKIARKPADKILAMRQLVHDTNYDPAELYNAGWPLRWQVDEHSATESVPWKVDANVVGRNVRQRYSVDAADGATSWLRYRHFVPDFDEWQRIADQPPAADARPGSGPLAGAAHPQLITDFNAYNTRVTREQAKVVRSLRPDPGKLGLHWVGDLMVEADVEVESSQGELLIDLVEGGRHFSATVDLKTGRAVLGIDGLAGFSPAAETPLGHAGSHHVAFSNVDDQLLLWVDGKAIKFDGSTEYDADQVFGSRGQIRPQTSDADPGDLAPVGIGARGAKLAVTRLEVWRDIYYIADSWQRERASNLISDFNPADESALPSLSRDPSLWNVFLKRRQVEFPLTQDEFFVMGDNSPESSDARLWCGREQQSRGKPGGAYLERQMLIGKALCVYWPHSWNRIPGTPIPFPLFPNFVDMRMVR